MKLHFLCFLLVIMLVSCDKEDQPKENLSNLPEWLQLKIQEIESTDEPCWSFKIKRYTYKRRYYYNFYSPIMSCMFCNFYNDQGKLISAEDNFDFDDFFASYTNETVVWSCSD